MKTIQELREEMSHYTMCARDLKDKADKENRALTEEESQQADDYLDQADQLEKQIKRMQEDEERKKKISERVDRLQQPEERKVKPAQPEDHRTETATQNRLPSAPRNVYHARRELRAFKGEDAVDRAYASGMWFMAALLNNKPAQRWCNQNGIEFERRAQTEGVNSAGGATVPAEMETAIINLREQFGVFRQHAGVMPMTSDTKQVARRTGGLTAYWVSEGNTATASDLTFDSIGLVAKKLQAITKVSKELDEDSIIDMIDLVAQEMALALATSEDTAAFNGTGISTNGGINGITTKFEANSSLAGYVLAESGNDEWGDITIADCTKVMGTLPHYADMMNPKWYVSKFGWANGFARLMYAAGGNTKNDVQGAAGREFLGAPVVITQSLPKSGDQSNKVMALYGALDRAATLGDRRGFTFDVSDQRFWDEDNIGLKGTERLDINIHDIGDDDDAGPIVALVGN